MDAIIIFTLIIIISGIMALIAWGIVHAQKEKEREEEQQRIAEQKRRKEEAERKAEEEWRKSTKCIICEEASDGHVICSDCWNRRLVIKKELPYKRVCTYELINEYKNELMYKIIFPETQLEREINSVKLLAVAEILDKKYCQSNALDKMQTFLEDVISDNI